MMYMIMLVLDDPDKLDALLDAWEHAGISGATIIESTGIHRRRRQLFPMRYVFPAAGEMEESGHYTLFVIVPRQQMVQACLAATEKVVGDLNQPNTGVFATWPIEGVKGVPMDIEE